VLQVLCFACEIIMTMRLSFVFHVFWCWACVDAARMQTQAQGGLEADAQGKFGASCETLQTRLRTRSKNLLDFSNLHSGADNMTVTASAFAVMKVSAVMRVLRRASDCPWVVNGSHDDIETVGKVVHSLLAPNPCAPAAVAELQLLGTDGEEGVMPLGRAMSILMSDTCKYEDQRQGSNEFDEIADVDNIEVEELVQDRVEEMMETTGTGSIVGQGSSLVEQLDMQRTRGVLYLWKLIGAIMFGVVSILACGFVGGFAGLIIGLFFGALLTEMLHLHRDAPLTYAFFGMSFGALSGAASCGAEFYRVVANIRLNQ